MTHASPQRRLGIVTTGKSWSDTVEALADLGIDEECLAAIGVEIFKVALVWPLEPESLNEFAGGLDELLVIEESRPFLEPQIANMIVNLPAERRPLLLGKRNADGQEWLPSHGELTPVLIARVLYRWLEGRHRTEAMGQWIAYLDRVETELARPRSNVLRTPYFCSGCPHNTSTKIPDGSQQLAGIGCHWLVNLMDRETVTYPQMGGEGANWAGAAHFVENDHIFANVGDGTWYHSGSLAIRQAVAAGVTMTYKILYNDAVAMTGGQPVDGPISVTQITHELRGEAVARIAVVSSDPIRFDVADFAPGTTLHHRDELELVQRDLRERPGVSVIIYEQTCATELRRRRGKKLAPEPDRRVFINHRVCEGCGDCSVQSNCLSVQPYETEFGRKRMIDQSACNKDFSCIKGFCPSFVTIEGGKLASPPSVSLERLLAADLPDPAVAPLDGVFGMMVAGIGGTGVVTISNLVGAAAQAEGLAVQALDLTGLAQKFGAVYCHLKIATDQRLLRATRLSVGQCDVLIGADIVTSASDESLSRLRHNGTRAVVNDHETTTGEFTRNRDFSIPIEDQKQAITRFCGDGYVDFVEATELARELTGNTIGANVMLLGFACQKGWLPVSLGALEEAIRANGVAVASNLNVFRLGRLLAHDAEAIEAMVKQRSGSGAFAVEPQTLGDLIERRASDLVAYQDESYAARYAGLIERVRQREAELSPGSERLTETVARSYYKLLAYKDEYEVARLYTDGAFLEALGHQFSGDFKINFHFAPPLLPGIDEATGRPRKRSFGRWALPALRVLAGMKRLRGTSLDPFGRSEERKAERQLIVDYESDIEAILAHLSGDKLDAAAEFASWPATIAGYGPVKHDAISLGRDQRSNVRRRFLSSIGAARGLMPASRAG